MKPTKCPPDAFCPAGSTEPQYCMEAFLYKVGSSCQLAPLAIVLLALLSAGEHHLLQPRVVPAVGSGWCMLQFLKSGFLLKVLLVARPFKRKQRPGVPSVAIKSGRGAQSHPTAPYSLISLYLYSTVTYGVTNMKSMLEPDCSHMVNRLSVV